MKKTIFFLATTAIASALILGGCKGKKQQDATDGPTAFERYVTARDTLRVQELVNLFFLYAESGNYMEASAMLYKSDATAVNEEPMALDNDEMQDVCQMLESLHPAGHSIEYIKFNQTHSNEVRVKVTLQKATDDAPEVTTVMNFKPVDYLDKWYLCMLDSRQGDHAIVRGEDIDSLSVLYQEQTNATPDTVSTSNQ